MLERFDKQETAMQAVCAPGPLGGVGGRVGGVLPTPLADPGSGGTAIGGLGHGGMVSPTCPGGGSLPESAIHQTPLLGMEICAVVITLIVVAAALLVAHWWLRRPRHWSAAPVAPTVSPMAPALGELGLLYARGEVTRDEFLARRADLV